MTKFRIAIIESPNPIDSFSGISEAKALEEASRIFGHQVVSFFVRSRREFQETIKFLAAADSEHAIDCEGILPLVLHISCHGNDGCIAIGPDSVKWTDLLKDIRPLISNSNYLGKLTLSLSSCGSGKNTISKLLGKSLVKQGKYSDKIPQYIFSISGKTVSWEAALIAWSLLYLKLSEFGIDDKTKVKKSLNEVLCGTGVAFNYSRFDVKKGAYKKWTAQI